MFDHAPILLSRRNVSTALACASGFAALVLLAAPPSTAQSVLDRMRDRAAERAQTQTENEAGQRVDSAVDQGVDCMFNPVECAKKVPTGSSPAGAPPAGEVGGPAGAPPATDATEWYAESQGQRVGPMPRSQLDALVTQGEVKAETLVWREGMSAWTPAGSVADLAPVFKKLPPPLPPQRSGPPPLPSR